jgi:hypothetical protein
MEQQNLLEYDDPQEHVTTLQEIHLLIQAEMRLTQGKLQVNQNRYRNPVPDYEVGNS